MGLFVAEGSLVAKGFNGFIPPLFLVKDIPEVWDGIYQVLVADLFIIGKHVGIFLEKKLGQVPLGVSVNKQDFFP